MFKITVYDNEILSNISDDDVSCYDTNNNEIEYFTQWDIGQSIKIKNTTLTTPPIFHFGNINKKDAFVVESSIVVESPQSNSIVVQVPNKILTYPYDVQVYMYVMGDNQMVGKSIARIRLPVKPRAKPEGYNYIENTEVIEKMIEDSIKNATNDIKTEIDLVHNEVMDISDFKPISLNKFNKNNFWEQGAIDNKNDLGAPISSTNHKRTKYYDMFCENKNNKSIYINLSRSLVTNETLTCYFYHKGDDGEIEYTTRMAVAAGGSENSMQKENNYSYDYIRVVISDTLYNNIYNNGSDMDIYISDSEFPEDPEDLEAPYEFQKISVLKDNFMDEIDNIYARKSEYLSKDEMDNIVEYQTTSDNLFDNLYDLSGLYNLLTGVFGSNSNFKASSKLFPIKTTGSVLYFWQKDMVSADNTPSVRICYYSEDLTYVGYKLVNYQLNTNNILQSEVNILNNARYFRIFTNANIDCDVYIGQISFDNISDVPFNEFSQEIKNVKTDAVRSPVNLLLSESNNRNKIFTSKSQCAEKGLLFNNFPRTTYYVGQDKEYQTIGSAIMAWYNADRPKATMYISNGEYKFTPGEYTGGLNNQGGYRSVLYVPPSDDNRINDIEFIGESREGVIIHGTNGTYLDAPVLIKHGNVKIENITVISDHSENDFFSYIGDQEGGARWVDMSMDDSTLFIADGQSSDSDSQYKYIELPSSEQIISAYGVNNTTMSETTYNLRFFAPLGNIINTVETVEIDEGTNKRCSTSIYVYPKDAPKTEENRILGLLSSGQFRAVLSGKLKVGENENVYTLKYRVSRVVSAVEDDEIPIEIAQDSEVISVKRKTSAEEIPGSMNNYGKFIPTELDVVKVGDVFEIIIEVECLVICKGTSDDPYIEIPSLTKTVDSRTIRENPISVSYTSDIRTETYNGSFKDGLFHFAGNMYYNRKYDLKLVCTPSIIYVLPKQPLAGDNTDKLKIKLFDKDKALLDIIDVFSQETIANDGGKIVFDGIPYVQYFSIDTNSNFENDIINNKIFFSSVKPEMPGYGMHIDGGNPCEINELSEVLIKNCTVISQQAPALGMGTIPRSKIRIENSEIISFTEPVNSNIHSNHGISAYDGALLLHTSALTTYPSTEENDYANSVECLELINTNIHAHNWKYGMRLTGSGEEGDERYLNLLSINTTLSTSYIDDDGIEHDVAEYINDKQAKGSDVILDRKSIGNTDKQLNYSN